MIVYSNPILLPILSSSVMRATQGGMTAITAPLLNPYITANAMINCADWPVAPSIANGIDAVICVEGEAMRVLEGSQRAKQKSPDSSDAGVSVLNGPMRSARRGGKRRPRTEAPLRIAREVEKDVVDDAPVVTSDRVASE